MDFAELKARIAEEARRLEFEEEPWQTLPKAKSPVHRRDFLLVPAENFLFHAYRTLLGREVDPTGQAGYGPLCSSWLGRVAVLGHLAASAEAKARGVAVRGVRFWRLMHAGLSRLPLTTVWLALADFWLRLWDWPAYQERALSVWQRLAEQGGELQNQISQALEQNARLARTVEEQMAEQNRAVIQLKDSQTRLQACLGQTERRLEALLQAPEPYAVVAEQEALDRFYLAFEEACRGSPAAVRAKLESYLPLLESIRDGQIADLGCGRGEWLELLGEHGFSAVGIETSPAMLERCLNQGLNVVAADALAWLEGQPENSLAAVTAFHVLEHLPFAKVLSLVQQAYRVLRPKGLAIFETPNPENVLVGSHTFYHDPTHRHPLTPTLMEFVLRYAGFKEVRILRLNPYPPEAKVPGDGTLVERVNGHFYGPQDFAVIGVK